MRPSHWVFPDFKSGWGRPAVGGPWDPAADLLGPSLPRNPPVTRPSQRRTGRCHEGPTLTICIQKLGGLPCARWHDGHTHASTDGTWSDARGTTEFPHRQAMTSRVHSLMGHGLAESGHERFPEVQLQHLAGTMTALCVSGALFSALDSAHWPYGTKSFLRSCHKVVYTEKLLTT